MEPSRSNSASPATWKIILCFACIYLIWGSTYLAIKFVIVAVSPLLMTGARFFCATLILFVVGLLRREVGLQKSDRIIACESGLLLATANALVCVSEQWISSGTAAVLCGASPVMILLLNWVFFDKRTPRPRQVLGIFISFAGVYLLSRAPNAGDIAAATGTANGVLAVMGALLLWGIGSLVQRRAGVLPNIFRFTATQLLSGAVGITILGLLIEDPRKIDLAALAPVNIFCFFYLVVFGSAIAFSSYLFLHRHVEPGKVSTYAVVNPMIAVWLGWLIAGEAVNSRTVIYSLFVIIGLYFAVLSPRRKKV